MSTFDRWNSVDRYSYAFRLFARYHNYLNSLYWAHIPASDAMQFYCRNALKDRPGVTTQELFNLKGNDAIRVASSIEIYQYNLKEFDNWTRLNALLALSSYFETYLASVVSLSIESDPGLLYFVSRKVDGALILKHGREEGVSFSDKSEEITRGAWSERIAHFGKMFGAVPLDLHRYEGDLEEIRRIRNYVAHAFGRDIDETRSRATFAMIPIERVSPKTIKRYLGTIEKIAKAVDRQLMINHIGEFELIYFYHLSKDHLSKGAESRELKRKINSLQVQNRDESFCRTLIEYYRAL